MSSNAVPLSYFVEFYQRESGPWHFATSECKREKYEATLRISSRLVVCPAVAISSAALGDRSRTISVQG
ncbi:MAG: hypothetical protein ACXVAS_06025 [Vulcanimicrobiaceae bacterium]